MGVFARSNHGGNCRLPWSNVEYDSQFSAECRYLLLRHYFVCNALNDIGVCYICASTYAI